SFVDPPGEWLLAVNVLAELHRGQTDRSMHVIGSANHDSVNLAVQRVEELAIVTKALGLGILFECFGCPTIVDVAECDDILAGNSLEIFKPLAAAADDREIQLVAVRRVPGDRGGRL